MIEALLVGQLTWNMPMLICLLVIVLAYIYCARYWDYSGIHTLHISLFIIAAGLFYLLLGSPLKTISHLSFSFHMTYMSILYFFGPPLILMSLPHIVTQFANGKKTVLLCKIALYLFAVCFLLYHIPYVMIFMSKYASIRSLYEYLLLLLALLMWWPLVLPSYINKKRYAFLNGALLMPSCMVFILAAFMGAGNNPMLTQLSAMLCMPADMNIQPLPPPFQHCP
ncbi:cytochrome c oxidase assembly protein [Virgibacillus halophilus]|uniref:Cytochrome c oxidase assembly protein n=1 Tax=Tigheibacillus halophilus TaxID=361280 RepID=A0ABU5C1N7_9BACI|nr:cytochrome c oxidase assembly protein [Virgibacillus halophilus]